MIKKCFDEILASDRSYINNLREKAPVRRAGDLGSNPGPGENLS